MTPFINRGMKFHWLITRISVFITMLYSVVLFDEGLVCISDYNAIGLGILYCFLAVLNFAVSVFIFAKRKFYCQKLYQAIIFQYVVNTVFSVILLAFVYASGIDTSVLSDMISSIIALIIALYYYSRRKEIFALNIPVSEAGVINNETRNKIKKEIQIVYDFNDPTIYTDYQEDLEKPINESPSDENALQSEENCVDEGQPTVIPVSAEDNTEVNLINVDVVEPVNKPDLESKVPFNRLCYKCGKLYPEDGKFCPYCGEEYKEETSDTKFCIYCGATLPMDARFCRSCGKKQPTED